MGLPASHDDFMRDVAGFPQRGHYAWAICQHFETAEAAWIAVGSKIALLASDLLNVASDAGAPASLRQFGRPPGCD